MRPRADCIRKTLQFSPRNSVRLRAPNGGRQLFDKHYFFERARWEDGLVLQTHIRIVSATSW